MLQDIGVGLILSTLLCWAFGIDPTWLHFVLGIASSLILDLDALPELFGHGKVGGNAENPHDHRDGLHYPLIVIPLAFVAAFFVFEYLLGGNLVDTGDMANGGGLFWAILCAACLLAHFVHDSYGLGWGVAWLYPFNTRKFKLFSRKDNSPSFASQDIVCSWSKEEQGEYIRKYGDPDWLKKFLKHPLFYSEVLIFVVGIVVAMVA